MRMLAAAGADPMLATKENTTLLMAAAGIYAPEKVKAVRHETFRRRVAIPDARDHLAVRLFRP